MTYQPQNDSDEYGGYEPISEMGEYRGYAEASMDEIAAGIEAAKKKAGVAVDPKKLRDLFDVIREHWDPSKQLHVLTSYIVRRRMPPETMKEEAMVNQAYRSAIMKIFSLRGNLAIRHIARMRKQGVEVPPRPQPKTHPFEPGGQGVLI